MRRLKLLGLAVLALFAFATAQAASAALPANLPELVTARTFTGEAIGASTFETLAKLKVECKKARLKAPKKPANR